MSAQPMWGQRGRVGVSRLRAALAALAANWGRSMEREGEKTPAYGFLFPQIRSVRSPAATMEVVMPHF